MKRHYREDNNYTPDKNVNYEEVIRVFRHTELPTGDPIHMQGWVQNGTPTQCPREQSLDLPL